MAVTLRDVAAHAGVSFRTVSNVVNNYSHVSPAMREKVQASLDELGYKPNLLARSLRAGRTGIITLLVPDLRVPYFGELAHEVVEVAAERGCTVMIDETGGAPERELALLDTAAQSKWVDGVLLSSLGLSASQIEGLGPRLGGSMKVVLLGEHTARGTYDHVGIDNVAAATAVVQHLLDVGCRRVAALGGTTRRTDFTTRQRVKGYREALGAAGLAGTARHVTTPDYRPGSGAAAVGGLLDSEDPPDGLFCLNDELAAGAMRVLHERGVSVPAGVAVAGFDDADVSRYLTPSLTSVRQDRAETARAALDVLLARVDGSTEAPRDVPVPWEVVPRESTER